MSQFRIPVQPDLSGTTLGQILERQVPDRRTFMKAATGLGMSIPALLAARQATAQESTPEGAYSGGHGNDHGTGDATPDPSLVPTEHVVFDPWLPKVEPGPKEFTISAIDATVFVAKDTPYAGWTWDGTIPGTVQRVVQGDEVTVTVPAEQIQEAARRCKEHEQLRYDYLRCLSGVDYQAEGIEVAYHLFSTPLLQKCVLKARVSGEGQGLPSVTPVWAGANWHERETAEMFNIRFDGHPKLEPLLLEKDDEGRIVPGPILLKRFPLFGPPGIIFFDAQGREIRGLRVIGYQDADRFLAALERALAP